VLIDQVIFGMQASSWNETRQLDGRLLAREGLAGRMPPALREAKFECASEAAPAP
jgi:hypothetical protein